MLAWQRHRRHSSLSPQYGTGFCLHSGPNIIKAKPTGKHWPINKYIQMLHHLLIYMYHALTINFWTLFRDWWYQKRKERITLSTSHIVWLACIFFFCILLFFFAYYNTNFTVLHKKKGNKKGTTHKKGKKNKGKKEVKRSITL